MRRVPQTEDRSFHAVRKIHHRERAPNLTKAAMEPRRRNELERDMEIAIWHSRQKAHLKYVLHTSPRSRKERADANNRDGRGDRGCDNRDESMYRKRDRGRRDGGQNHDDDGHRPFWTQYPVVPAVQRPPVNVPTSDECKNALPPMLPEDAANEIAAKTVAASEELLFPPSAKREVDRVIRKQYRPSQKEMEDGMVTKARIAAL